MFISNEADEHERHFRWKKTEDAWVSSDISLFGDDGEKEKHLLNSRSSSNKGFVRIKRSDLVEDSPLYEEISLLNSL